MDVYRVIGTSLLYVHGLGLDLQTQITWEQLSLKDCVADHPILRDIQRMDRQAVKCLASDVPEWASHYAQIVVSFRGGYASLDLEPLTTFLTKGLHDWLATNPKYPTQDSIKIVAQLAMGYLMPYGGSIPDVTFWSKSQVHVESSKGTAIIQVNVLKIARYPLDFL